jgi:hypothetical protein
LGVGRRRVEEEVEGARNVADGRLDASGEGWALGEWEREVEIAVSPNGLCYPEEKCFDVE